MDNDTNAQTQYVERKADSQRRKDLRKTLFCVACGLLAVLTVVYARVRVPHSNVAATFVGTVAATPAAAPPRNVKLIDASQCTRAQIKIVDDTLVTDPACTTVVYDDGSTK